MRAGWVKRVLFLADRVALVQPGGERVQDPPAVGDDGEPGEREVRRGPGLRVDVPDDDGPDRPGSPTAGAGSGRATSTWSIVDEAHRSVYAKYGAIFDYFDSFLVGLTATPKDEVDRNTYSLFHLEEGVPTDAYSLDEAVARRVSWSRRWRCRCRCKFLRQGIRYDDLSEDEKDAWDALEWSEDGVIPDRGGCQPGQLVAVQHRHRRQGTGHVDDARPSGRRR